jgi:epoxyqueuosine reductase QueG
MEDNHYINNWRDDNGILQSTDYVVPLDLAAAILAPYTDVNFYVDSYIGPKGGPWNARPSAMLPTTRKAVFETFEFLQKTAAEGASKGGKQDAYRVSFTVFHQTDARHKAFVALRGEGR